MRPTWMKGNRRPTAKLDNQLTVPPIMKAAGRYDCSNSSPVRMKGIPPGGEYRRTGQQRLRSLQQSEAQANAKRPPSGIIHPQNERCAHLLFKNLGIRGGELVKNKNKMNLLQQMSTFGGSGGENNC